MYNNPKSSGTKDDRCCSLPIIIRQNDAKFIVCDKNLQDLDKCQSCISAICQKPIKIYANSRNSLACELMIPLPQDCIRSTPNGTGCRGMLESNSQGGVRKTILIPDDHCVDCLAPKCKPEKVKSSEYLCCDNLACPDNMKSFKPKPDLRSKKIRAIKKAVLKETNRYRRMHRARPLKLDDKLSAYAQEWAEHLASEDLLETRPDPIYGENIISARKPLFNIERLMKLWYQEKYNYDYRRPGFNIYSGHFTQMVWLESQLLGVGIASNDYRIWIVCNYDPAGNIKGLFQENVIPRKMFLSDSDMEMDKMKKAVKSKSTHKQDDPTERDKFQKITNDILNVKFKSKPITG